VSNAVDPREEVFLTELAATLGVRLTLRAGIGDDELVRIYNEALLTVYAPRQEPLGLVTLESMACGTPVVGVGEAGVRETVVHGETGVLVDRDPDRFGRAVESLLDDEPRRAAYGRRGIAYVATDWNWEVALVGLEAQLAEAAGRGAGTRG
jgi:glycosyltransferase involved in cell wall biosynthesis